MVDSVRIDKKLNAGIFAGVLAIMLLSQFSMTVAASDLQSKVPSALQTFTETFEVIPDPSLRAGGSFSSHGDSDEFSGLVSAGSGPTSGYVNLIWTHVAGTEVQLAQVPDIGDFCYTPIAFNWNLERVPIDAMFYLNYAILTTGDFNSTDGAQMFKVRSWLIDSSDNWEPLFESEPPYTTTSSQYSYDLNYFDLANGWEGMVEDENGVQEDPQDVLQVAVGLTSTENFDSYNGDIPWQEYNGTVIARVDSLSLVVTVESDGIGLIGSLILVAVPVSIIAAVVFVYLMRRRHERVKV